MGGYGSGRWLGVATRHQTDQVCALDVRFLAKKGLISPKLGVRETMLITWKRGETDADSVEIDCEGSGESFPSTLTLVYRRHNRRDGEAKEVRATVALCRTAVHLGGERVWFQCPGCSRRCAILRRVGDLFHCHRCQQLAYPSTREDAGVRAGRRQGKMLDRLNAPPGESRNMPAKPPGMHWTTYTRLVDKIRGEG